MKRLIVFLVTTIIAGTVQSQNPKDIKLNAPDLDRGVTVMKAFEKRASASSFSDKELSLQDLSDLLWAADGINRPENGKRTAPSAMNAQDVDVFVFMKNGVYLYEAKTHSLIFKTEGDHRPLVAGSQANFAKAPVMLLLVSDISRFRGDDIVRKMSWAAMDAGIVSQNISLFCAGTGLMTRPRAFMETERIKQLLKMSDTQYPLLNNPVGYPAE